MRILNKTDWNTSDLRRVFALVLKRWNQIDDRKVNTKRLKNITVVNSRWRTYISGHAYLNSGTMRLRLPKEAIDVKQLAFLFEHELAHCAGYEHARMGPLNSWKLVGSGRYDYVAGILVRKKEPKAAKPRPDVQIVRYQSALKTLARWQTKAKRASTGIKTYRAKVRYYEKALAADGRLTALKTTGETK